MLWFYEGIMCWTISLAWSLAIAMRLPDNQQTFYGFDLIVHSLISINILW